MSQEKCINCHYFEVERSYFKPDKNGVTKYSAPCYISQVNHFEDDRCKNIKLFEYFRETK